MSRGAGNVELGIRDPRGLEVAGVSDAERRIIQQAFSNPLEIPAVFKGWMESYLEPIVKDVVGRGIQSIPDVGVWKSYTPAWTSTGVAPVLNNGTIAGRYVQIGKLLVVRAQIIWGSGTSPGTGSYRLSLPVSTSGSAGGENGQAFAFDSSASGFYFGYSRWASATTVDLYSGASPSVIFGPTSPFAWAAGDLMELNAIFEAS